MSKGIRRATRNKSLLYSYKETLMPKKGNTKSHKTVDCNSWGSMEEEEKPKSLPLYRNLYLLKLLDRNNPKFPLNNRHSSKTLRFNRQPSKTRKN